jgi:hypothetical protein
MGKAVEQLPSTARPPAVGSPARPTPKNTTPQKKQETSWDVPSSDDETPRRLTAFSKLAKPFLPTKAPKGPTASHAPQKSSGAPSRHNEAEQEKKRKREKSDSVVAQKGREPRQKSVPPPAAPLQSILKRPAKSIDFESSQSSQPARKRQRTPSKFSPPVALRTRSRTTTPEPQRAYGTMNGRPSKIAVRSPTSRTKVQSGSSAPATLFKMIRDVESPPTDSSENTVPSTPNLYSDMDVDLPSTPPAQATSPASIMRNGSVTPRQKELWGKLLGSDPIDGPSDLPPISKLHLHSANPRKGSSLPRSSSDVPQSTHSRRVRLIDSLKASAPIEEEDEDMDDISEEEEGDVEESRPVSSQTVNTQVTRKADVTIKTSTAKITYGPQRSYLEPKNEEAAFDELMQELSQPMESQASQYQNQDLDEDDSQLGMARGFHDLRAAGSNLRLSDMFDNLINEIEGPKYSLSIRRNALMELATKFLEQSAATYFLDRGFDRRLVKALGDLTDTTSNFVAAAAVALLADAGASADALYTIRQSRWYTKVVELLALDVDISRVVKDRKSNMSKVAQLSVVEFKDAMLKSKMWAGDTPKAFSPQLMGLKCLELLVRKMREYGNLEMLLDEKAIETLLAIVESKVEGGLSDTVAPELVLSILESSSTTPATQKKPSGWPSSQVKIFAQLLSFLIASSSSLEQQRCGDLALRLSLNLTNENPKACDVFGSSSITQPLIQSIIENFDRLKGELSSEERARALDRLTLSLGAMINLAEFSDKVRVSVIQNNNDALLTRVVELFVAGRERTTLADSLESMQTNVPYGYLAILLGNLCQNEKIRKKVQRSLASEGGGLGILVGAVDEFTRIHQIADRDCFEGDEGREVYSRFTARLQGVAEALRVVAAEA